MIQIGNQINEVRKKRFERRLDLIRRQFSSGHLYLLYHASILTTLTSELLYRIWANFQYDIHGEFLDIPWIAISDLIFSPLCEEVGYEIYEIELFVRNKLLKEFIDHPRFGNKRIQELAKFIEIESRYDLDSPDIDKRDLAQAHLWTALVYSSINEAVYSMAQYLSEIDIEESFEWARMTSLIEAFEEPLKKANLDSLLIYVRGMYFWNRREKEKSKMLFDYLDVINNKVLISDVSLTVPSMESVININPSIILELEEFEFEIATIESIKTVFPVIDKWKILRKKNYCYCFIESSIVGLNLEMVSVPTGQLMSKYLNQVERYSTSIMTCQSLNLFVSRYPITQIQWRLVSELPQIFIPMSSFPSGFCGPHLPVENINWYEVVEFCARLSKASGKLYRLPTEIEWEYVCRAGTDFPFHFGATLSPKLANYNATKSYASGPTSKVSKCTTIVGKFNASNSFGFSDMHGNIWEWCFDINDYVNLCMSGYQNKYDWVLDDISEKVIRGGSWKSFPEDCQSKSHFNKLAVSSNNDIGFRVAVSYL